MRGGGEVAAQEYLAGALGRLQERDRVFAESGGGVGLGASLPQPARSPKAASIASQRGTAAMVVKC